MTSPRFVLTLFAILGSLALVPSALADPADSGGAVAEPVPQTEGGGTVGPAAESVAGAAQAGDEAPSAEAGQEDTPTTPEGEDQNGEEEPEDEVEETPEEETEDGATTGGDTGAAEDTNGLPSTGAELGAMAAMGLGLLMLGAALRPRQAAGR